MHLKNHPVASKTNVQANVGHTQIDILDRILAQARLDLEGSEKKSFFSAQKFHQEYISSRQI